MVRNVPSDSSEFGLDLTSNILKLKLREGHALLLSPSMGSTNGCEVSIACYNKKKVL